jgi:hypothetical protein
MALSSAELIPGRLLIVLAQSAVFQVNGDAGCPPGVTSDWGEKTRGLARLRIAAQALYRFSGPSLINALEEGLSVLKAYGHSVLVQDLEQEVVEHLLRWLQGTSIGIAFSSGSFIESMRNHISSIEMSPPPDGLLPMRANIWTST